MCANWYYVHYPDKLKRMSLKEYKDLITGLENELVKHDYFITNLEPNLEGKVKIDRNNFSNIQNVVFKILNMINSQKELYKDFD